MKVDFIHTTGLFAGLKKDDIVTVIYHGAETSKLVVTRVNKHSFEGLDGELKCIVTNLGTELRFYGPLVNNRQTVLRDVRLVWAK